MKAKEGRVAAMRKAARYFRGRYRNLWAHRQHDIWRYQATGWLFAARWCENEMRKASRATRAQGRGR